MMESDSLLGTARSTVSKVVIVAFIVIVAAVLAISISAIVLSTRAINTTSDNQAHSDNVNSCFYPGTEETQTTYAPKGPYNTVTTLIRNATVWTGTGTTFPGHDILIEGGIITQIAPSITPPVNATIYDVAGAFVTPGLVDMHSHTGVYSFPEDSFGTSDGNEMTNPTMPQVRAIDAFDPEDPAIPLILSGGITTSLVLPGSGNVVGGEAVLVKMKGGSVGNMVITPAPRLFKMAAGENPKRVYGSEGKLPMTRMGNIWTMRQMFSSALQIKQQQDQWDCVAKTGERQQAARPYDASLESVVQILRKNALVNVHCYQVQDFEAVLRVFDEFGIKVNAFHHALEAWKIPEVFVERNITLATFSDMWGFKLEGFDGSVWAPSKLVQAGASVAFKSDHPVIYAKYLMYEAAKGFHYGLDAETALRAVTVVPATAIGLIDRIGTIEVGKDGDIAVWDRHPLALGATPVKVFIEGQLYQNVTSTSGDNSANTPVVSTTPLVASTGDACSGNPLNTYTIQDVTVHTQTGAPVSNANIVVNDGIITCVGEANACPAGAGPIFTVSGGIVIPGIISTATDVGLMEVESEGNSQDGAANLDNGANIYAADGMRLGTRHISAAWKGGVTVQLATPQGSGLIAGVSSAFYTAPTFSVASDSLLSQTAALHINIGNNAKISSATKSVSSQFATLRSTFRASLTAASDLDPVYLALTGALPVVFSVDQADEIDAILRLKSQFNMTRVVIIGGAEAAIAAPKLAQHGVGVILNPIRSSPGLFETKRGTTATPGILAANNVPVAVAMNDPSWVRNLRWEAGYALDGGLSAELALASVTSVPASLLGLPNGTGTIVPGTRANFVLYNGDPLSLSSLVKLVALGTYAECNPLQY